MKPDPEDEYVGDIVEREQTPPRSLPGSSFTKLYFLSPNSRYSVLAAFVCIAIIGFLIFARMQHVPYADSSASTQGIIMGLLLMVFAFAFPLLYVQRLTRGIRYGIYTIGTVDRLLSGVIGATSTYAGMQNGAVKAVISYTVNGLEGNSTVFLDRPWVRDLEEGTQLRLLVDPEKRSVLYVIGIAEQPRRLLARHEERLSSHTRR